MDIMNVMERLWATFDDMYVHNLDDDTRNLIRKNPDNWTYCGTSFNEYIKRAEWIDENIIGDVDIKIAANINSVFIFSDDEDAVAFKLRWI